MNSQAQRSLSPWALKCPIKDYAWGRAPGNSIISRLSPDAAQFKHCAELWVGAHPSAPSLIESSGGSAARRLDHAIAENPQASLGARTVGLFGPQLPFLFKVLSIDRPLSIQMHPDKARAEELHRREPAWYPDDNHKPEVAVALSDVRLLYGFRPFAEIARELPSVPELQQLLGQELCHAMAQNTARSEESKLLSRMYHALMLSSAENVKQASQKLFARLSARQQLSSAEDWVLRLQKYYPQGDVGLFSFFVQNIESRRPGEAVFIGANIPHAYLEGELVECMASSDNVIRAGLTEKHKDVRALVDSAEYSSGSAPLISPQQIAKDAIRYDVPAREFFLENYSGTAAENLASDSAQIIFCLEAEGELQYADAKQELRAGSAYFIPAACPTVKLLMNGGTVFRAGVPD